MSTFEKMFNFLIILKHKYFFLVVHKTLGHILKNKTLHFLQFGDRPNIFVQIIFSGKIIIIITEIKK